MRSDLAVFLGRNFKSDYFKSVVTLMSGTLLSQVIPFLFAPVMTRLYGPDSYGKLGIFMGIAVLLSTISTGKFEVAQIHPEEDEDADHLLKLGGIVSFLFLLSVFVVAVLLELLDVSFVKSIQRERIWYFIPVAAFLLSINNGFYLHLNRKKKYARMSKGRVLFSLSVGTLSLVFGLTGFLELGLIWSYILGQTFVSIYMLTFAWKSLAVFKLSKGKELLRQYRNYPMFAMPSGLCNVASVQLPVLLVSRIFSTAMSGHYFLVERMMSAPVSLVGSSVGSVFRQKAQEDFYNNSSYTSLYVKTLVKLVLIAAPFFVVIGIFGADLFSIFFGSRWREAGTYAQLLAPFFFLKFVVSPLMSSVYVSNKLRVDFAGQLVYLLFILGAIFLGYYTQSINIMVIGISLSGCVFYLFFFILTFQYSKGR